MTFRITQHRGFQLTFANGVTISVQFGPGNYCQHYPDLMSSPMSVTAMDAPARASDWESVDAEIAIWNREGCWHEFEHDTVKGHVTSDDVATWIAFAATYDPKVDGALKFTKDMRNV